MLLVEALGGISKTLGKENWNFSADPCSGESGWTGPAPTKVFENAVTCDCSYQNSICHIVSIVIKGQNLQGVLPPEFVKLPYLQQIDLSYNYLNSTIPAEWGSMQLVNISLLGNRLTGPIPEELWNIPTLRNLTLEANRFAGPLPPKIGGLVNIEQLDLSFNNLAGEFPPTFNKPDNSKFIFLTSNLLTGTVPEWLLENVDQIDLSYNNMMLGRSGQCQQGKLNLFGSHPTVNNLSEAAPCLKDIGCQKLLSSLHINCGGKEVTVPIDEFRRKTTFSEDQESGSASKFFLSRQNWAFSSTGNFLDNGDLDTYIASNISRLSMSSFDLYTSARLSPLSLTYYGLCLLNGNYTVKLHFAEIMFTDDITYKSLGKRIFDVYIQGKLVLKDLNIEDEAGGTHIAVVKNFTAVVTTHSLEIRFYWAGKGTQCIPNKGTYGPLISAISVQSDFEPPSEDGKQISVGAVIGIVASAFCVIFLILGILWWKGCLDKKSTMYEDLKRLDMQTGSFSLRQIKAATNNFDAANKIGEGGFGPVYKGLLSDGTIIAVKQLSSKSNQGNREFVNEIGMISALQHPNLVKLYGCCIEGNQLLLVYEYMENNSLARALFGLEEKQLKLDWPTRHTICVGIARGLAYLQEESRLRIVHRDIKATNILLDKDLNPKISDFGLAKLDEEENTHISTRIAGTLGYMAPEYAMHGYLTGKADVYSFGVVTLEIVSGKNITSFRPRGDHIHLVDWAYVLQAKGNLMELVDVKLGPEFNKEEAMRMINVALLCTNSSPPLRPTMSAVVSMLEGHAVIQEVVSDPSLSGGNSKFNAFVDQYEQVQTQSPSRSQILVTSVDQTSSSSTSAEDLYPPHFISQHLSDRE
ncbi:hypothetical protein AAC387_Pa12g2115 [Persea americana]